MTALTVREFDFHGDTLLTTMHGGKPVVALRRVVESQQRGFVRHDRDTVALHRALAQDGQRAGGGGHHDVVPGQVLGQVAQDLLDRPVLEVVADAAERLGVDPRQVRALIASSGLEAERFVGRREVIDPVLAAVAGTTLADVLQTGRTSVLNLADSLDALIPEATLRAERAQWVLKRALGRVGDEVFVGALLSDEGACTIHEFRPIGCRGWTSFDRDDGRSVVYFPFFDPTLTLDHTDAIGEHQVFFQGCRTA